MHEAASTFGSPLALLIPFFLTAQTYQPGPQVLTFVSDIDATDQPYAVYVPKQLDTQRKYPLVVSLHDSFSNHRLNMRRVFGRGNRPGESDAEATRFFPPLRDVEFVVASPLARGTMGYQGIPEQDVYAVLADVKRRFPIDEDRIYLTGPSMGGGGTLWLGLTRPDVWAAIAAVCPAAPAGAEALAGNALNIPVKLFQGENDPVVPAAQTRNWHKLFLRSGVNSEYVEYPGVRHNSWDYAYKNGAIFDWFAPYRRAAHPDRVRLATRQYKYSSAYWVQIEALTPGTLASVDAKFTSRNAIDVRTNSLDGFTLRLAGHPLFTRTQALQVMLDGKPFRSKTSDAVSFSRSGAVWLPKRYILPANAKRRGAEGPIGEAFASRHVYVYGTADSPEPEEVRRRREVALHAASWSSPRTRLLLTLRVVADAEVSEADLKTANLILFGTRETNSLIARYADRLPLELNASAADYGLLFVTGVDGRHIVVSSGLPWWTRADQADSTGPAFIPAALKMLQSFGDYLFLKGGLDGIIASGLFDSNWKLPKEAAERMAATGAVKIR
jgi:pimeloyl-ACP methyl ester carboxylesterase